MRIVILEQPHKIDIKRLEEQAEVVFLFGGGKPRTSIMRCDVFMRAVADRLREINYDPAVDLVALLPPVLPTSLLMSVVSAQHKVFSVIIFNAVTSSYETRSINLETVCTLQ